MTVTSAYTEHLSETWLLERTYHAHLRNGRELSVPSLTGAMKQLIDFPIPLSSQSCTSKLAERVPLEKSTNISVPLPSWREISQEEASALYHQGIPMLLYGEHAWENVKGASAMWRTNRNMRVIIYGNACVQPEAVSGTEYAVCYLDPKRGIFSNDVWRAWFSSDTAAILGGSLHSTITFLGPCVQFPYTTHYTVIASDGHIHEYTDRAEAIQGFQTFPPQEEGDLHTVFPQFCYYHEVTCPGGIYRLEFFGPHMNEQGYHIKGGEERKRESIREAIR